jgi:hypothetical protein
MNWNKSHAGIALMVLGAGLLVFSIVNLRMIWSRWHIPQPTVTAAESATEARHLLRACTNQPGAVATVKTIWAGTPPVPVEYEITCQQEKTQ